MRMIYLDESESNNSEIFIGYGALSTEDSLADRAIIEAMNFLKDDPDIGLSSSINNKDKRTLNRGYFHASDDSDNAHSHLCRSINKNIQGIFKNDFIGIENKDDKKYNHILELTSHLSSQSLLNAREVVHLYFERRKGLTKNILLNSFCTLYDELVLLAYDKPFIPRFYPELEIEVVTKNNAGIQCVDFILWTVNRHFNNKSKWYNRLEANLKSQHYNQKSDWKGIDLRFKKGIIEPKTFYNFSDIPKNSDLVISYEMIENYFLHAEKVNAYFSQNDLPACLNYLKPKLIQVFSQIYSVNEKNHIENLVKNYLMLFDMIPLINNRTSQKDKENLLLSKKYLGLVLQKKITCGVDTKDYLNRFREHIISNQIELLKF